MKISERNSGNQSKPGSLESKLTSNSLKRDMVQLTACHGSYFDIIRNSLFF